MWHILSKVIPFLGIVFGHWQIWLSGGGFGGLIVIFVGFIEKLGGKNISKKAAIYLFLILFFVCSCFLAWVDENDKTISLASDKSGLTSQLAIASSQSSQKDGTIQTLQAQNRDQQNTINTAFVQLGKAQQPEPLKITDYFLGDLPRQTNTNVLAKYHGTFVVLTNKTLTPVRLLVTCEADLVEVGGTVLGAGAMTGGGWGGRVTRSTKQYGVGILTPAWTPATPLLVTIYTNQSNLGVCSFEEK